MNLQNLLYRFRWLHTPAGILMLLLQRTPVLRALVSESPGFGLQSGEVLKSAFALAALGAYNSVAGATVFNATPVSPTTVTPASGAANTTFTASGAQNAAFSVAFTATGAPGATRSWKVLGTFPAGLSVTGGTAITGGYLFNGITKVIIAGTPTAAGSQTLTVIGYDTTGGTGNNARVTCVINIAGPPVFTTQPLSQTVTAGGNVTFTAAAAGTPTPTFQWFLGTTALSGQTTSTLTLTNVQAVNAGNYTVKATNSAAPAGVSSNVASLTVNPAPVAPAFTTQPISQTIIAGGNVTFTAAAAGTPTPTFQWFLGTTALSGQTTSTLTLTNVQAVNAGNYTVKATNVAEPAGVSSNAAVLSVLTAIESWRLVEFGATANSGAAADTADPDGDGLPNLIEYALGGSPTSVGASPAPAVGTVLQGLDNHLTLTFTPRRPELTYAIETSSDLAGTWTLVPLSNPTMNQPLVFTDTPALSAAVRRFLRLSVTR